MSEFGVDPLGVSPLGGEVVRNPPTVTLTAPSATVTAERVTVGWTYLSTVPRPQAQFRVELRSQDGGILLFDAAELPVTPTPTGFTDLGGDEYLFEVPYLLAGGVTYQVTLAASDGFDWSNLATLLFTSELAGVSDIPDVPTVGSVHEIGLNGTGFMLADRPERPVRRRSILLEPPRFATSDTPFSEAVERYTMIGYSSFTAGAGQRFADRSRSLDDRFWQSEGVDPFEDGELRLLPDTDLEVATTYATPLTVVADERLYVLTGAKQFTAVDEPGDTPTVFTVDDASTIVSVTSDGVYWYASDGTEVFRNDVPVDPGSTPWSTVPAELIVWCSDRIVAIEDDNGDAVFHTLAPDGTEEVAGGRFKFEDATIGSVTAGDGYVWFSVDRGGTSEVRAWQLGGAPESVSFTAFTLPDGERVVGLGFYLGNVFIRASCGCIGEERPVIYRAIPNEGTLTAQRVSGIAGSGLDQSSGVWGGNDRYALFSWEKMTGDDRSGVGAIDLSTGGWAKWLSASDMAADGVVVSIVSWRGRPTFTVAGVGTYVAGDDPVAEGWIRTSHTDLQSSLTKVIDDVRVVFQPLGNGARVRTSISLDAGVSYVAAGTDVVNAGSTQATYPIGRTSGTVGIELRLFADSAVSPVVNVGQVRLHPLSLRDNLVVLPVNCSDTLTGLNGQILPESGPGRGMQRIRFLESLISTRVKFQDVDWPATKRSNIWEVVDVDTSGPGIYETRQNRRTESAVAVITLRRSA